MIASASAIASPLEPDLAAELGVVDLALERAVEEPGAVEPDDDRDRQGLRWTQRASPNASSISRSWSPRSSISRPAFLDQGPDELPPESQLGRHPIRQRGRPPWSTDCSTTVARRTSRHRQPVDLADDILRPGPSPDALPAHLVGDLVDVGDHAVGERVGRPARADERHRERRAGPRPRRSPARRGSSSSDRAMEELPGGEDRKGSGPGKRSRACGHGHVAGHQCPPAPGAEDSRPS